MSCLYGAQPPYLEQAQVASWSSQVLECCNWQPWWDAHGSLALRITSCADEEAFRWSLPLGPSQPASPLLSSWVPWSRKQAGLSGFFPNARPTQAVSMIQWSLLYSAELGVVLYKYKGCQKSWLEWWIKGRGSQEAWQCGCPFLSLIILLLVITTDSMSKKESALTDDLIIKHFFIHSFVYLGRTDSWALI